MKKFKRTFGLAFSTALCVALIMACQPIREFGSHTPYRGSINFNWETPVTDPSKINVFIIPDNNGTELFDMMAPYYLFNKTGKANVYIVAKNKYPVNLRKGLFLLPQMSFGEVDSLKLSADVIVIPAQIAAMESKHQDTVVLAWIKSHYSTSTKILSVCDGAVTAVATGIYDGKWLTTHASDYPSVKTPYSKPLWIQNTSVTQNGNLFSTAGVSNATEGSLTVINELFGRETMQDVAADVFYPHPDVKMEHQSVAVKGRNIVTLLKKVIFKQNKNIGLLLQNGINEFDLAAVLDTYTRSFPSSIKTYSTSGTQIKTKFGLTLLTTSELKNHQLDELHILNPGTLSNTDESFFKNTQFITYDHAQKQYIIDICLERISREYGNAFGQVTKLMLDYNN